MNWAWLVQSGTERRRDTGTEVEAERDRVRDLDSSHQKSRVFQTGVIIVTTQ